MAGPRTAGDTPTYSAWADALIAHRFYVPAFLRSQTFTAPLLLYLGWISIVALAKIAAGGAWAWALLAINGVAVCWTAMTTLISVSHWRPMLVAVLAAAWLMVSPDIWIFAPLILGDLWFTALSTAIIGALLRWPAAMPIQIIALAALATVTRPVTAPLIALVALVMSGAVRWSASSIRLAVAVAALGALAIVIAHAAVVTSVAWVPDWLLPWVEKLRGQYAQGVVVVERPETFVAPADTLLSAVRLTLLKWVFFFSPWLPGYSARHVAVNVLWFAPLYVAGINAVFRGVDRYRIHLLLLFILMVSGFHALQELDFDQRYRIPALPALVMLAALGPGNRWMPALPEMWRRKLPLLQQ